VEPDAERARLDVQRRRGRVAGHARAPGLSHRVSGGDALAAAELEAQGAALELARAGEDALLGVGRRVLGDEVEPGALSHARGRRAPAAEAARGRDREGNGRERLALTPVA